MERIVPTQFDFGFFVGLLIGEGHFGGDGRQPQVTLRMHVRHEAIFRWLEQTFPGGRLYGPYHHGGRHYLQWMARGAYLRDELAPILDHFLSPSLDRHSFDRYQNMKARYPQLTVENAASGESIYAHAAQLDQVPSLPADSWTTADAAPASDLTTSGLRSSDQAAAALSAVASEIGNAPSTATQQAPSAGSAATLDEILAQLRESWPS